MTSGLAASITKAASKQTYYTIRFLVDRPRVADAYRAYAYFRWVDDVLDAATAPQSSAPDDARAERLAFLGRQRSLLDARLHGERPAPVDPRERLLVDLVRDADATEPALRTYLVNMMRVMAFDVGRRGRLVSAGELDGYTKSLAVAVIGAMDHFIGGVGSGDRPDDDRHRAVAGAHILHMLRDTGQDLPTGYVNVPREVLEAGRIGPGDLHSDAYRAWVRERVRRADEELTAGAASFARHPSRRHRLAGLAYIARFRWLVDRLERDDFHLRRSYADAGDLATRVRLAASIAWSALVASSAVRADRPTRRPAVGRGFGGHP